MSKEDAKERAKLLKELREKHKVTVTHSQALLKEQNSIRKQIRQAMKDAPKTVPEVAETTGLPTDRVLWHLTAMKKYDLVAEGEMDGEYFQYGLVKEVNK